MLFWLLFALMTGAAVLAVLWPLGRRRAQLAGGREADLAVYRDQLAEIERDRARGVLPESEAEAARIEVSRRVLALADKESAAPAAGPLGRRRAAAVLALAGVPLLAIGLYGALGSPEMPDAPLQARLAKPLEQQDIGILVARIEAHLAQAPDDPRGWELLAPIYLRLGRGEDAVRAREHVLRLLGSNAESEADLGEALVVAANGVVNAEARAAFERARTHDPANGKAQFFLGLAAEQDGKRSEATAIWRALAEKAPPGDPWRIAAARRLEQVEAENSGKGN
ncbi:MAG: c-type cytochrome biogenesis protein CcmI [Bradyrhizobiaceae bacterium]|nr:c-type cytochrome biogenesis protein CcmI [Bradyrhizobiaceae bacterium]